MQRPRIAILGSGWGAFRLLKDIDAKKYAVTLVSPRNHVLFTPLLSSASVGSVNPGSICEPLRPHCAAKGARFCEAHAESLDLERRLVHCKSIHGDAYPVAFDRLVVAVGKQANDFNIPGVRQHALFMKETADATRLREALLSRLEEASCVHARADGGVLLPEQEAKVQQLLSVVVVGGGPTSVGFASELTDFIAQDVPRMYPHLREHISVHLVEWASTAQCAVLHLCDQGLRNYALRRLSAKPGVTMHRGEQVAEATARSLRLVSGKVIPCGTLVWNAGMKPVSFVQSLDVAKCSRGSKLSTDGFLRIRGQKDIFAIGDCAEVGVNGLPQTAHVANQQGAYLARELNTGEQFAKPFTMHGMGSLVCAGTAPASKISSVSGYLAWLGWRSAAWSMQLSMRNRVAIAGDRLSNRLFGHSLTRFGQDTAALPAGSLPKGAPAAGVCTVGLFDEQLAMLLNDIGMRQAGGGFLDPELMAQSSIAQADAPVDAQLAPTAPKASTEQGSRF